MQIDGKNNANADQGLMNLVLGRQLRGFMNGRKGEDYDIKTFVSSAVQDEARIIKIMSDGQNSASSDLFKLSSHAMHEASRRVVGQAIGFSAPGKGLPIVV